MIDLHPQVAARREEAAFKPAPVHRVRVQHDMMGAIVLVTSGHVTWHVEVDRAGRARVCKGFPDNLWIRWDVQHVPGNVLDVALTAAGAALG